MPKRTFKITEFEGGENRTKDPRDLELNECAQAKGVEFDKLGRIRVAGSGVEIKPLFKTTGDGDLHSTHGMSIGTNVYILNNGYGIFNFNHDYNLDSILLSDPLEIGTEIISIAYIQDTSLYIGFIDSKGSGTSIIFYPNIINLGIQNKKPKIQYYYVDGGLRIFDSEFLNTTTNTFYGHVKRKRFANHNNSSISNIWVEENQSLELESDFNVNRPYEGGSGQSGSNLYFQNLSNHDPSSPCNIILEIEESKWNDTNGIRHTIKNHAASSNGITTVETDNAHKFDGGDIIEIVDVSGSGEIFNGQYEVISGSGDSFTISLDGVDANELHTTSPDSYVCLAEDMINPELRAKWIFGVSYIIDGGQETKIARAQNSSGIMSASNFEDWTAFKTEPKMRFAFSIADDADGNTWSPRITGFRIYMKNIEGTTADQVSQEWNMLVDVDFEKGQYVIAGTDSTKRDLINDGNTFYNVAEAAEDGAGGDDIRFLSPITYESLNTYSDDETIEARYKTAVVANERVYIGNIVQNSQSYPDRILKSPVGSYDIFPESNFIEGVTSDGDSIVKLEYFGDRLFCFKNNTLQIINISDEEEYLEESLAGHGVSHPCQVVKTNDGIAYVNKTGLYLHNGSELVNLTQNKIHPFNFNPKDIYANGFFFEGAVPNLGYDEESNKLILVRSSVAYNYQVDIVEDNHQSIHTAFTDSTFGDNGYIYFPSSGAAKVGDIFQVQGTYDFTGDDLSIAKFGEGERLLNANDYFIITSVSNNNQKIEYLDLDADAFIYDLTNNCFSLRNFAFGANNVSYNMTNFINTNMFSSNNKLLLLKDASGVSQNGTNIDIVQWEDNPVTIESMNKTFLYKTRDIDFGDPAIRKKIYKVYITFKANDGKGTHANSEIRVYHLSNQDGSWTEFDDSSTNYNSTNGLYSEGNDSDWQIAELKPTSSINNIYSFQLKFENTNGDVPRGFEINDISIVYRSKPIR